MKNIYFSSQWILEIIFKICLIEQMSLKLITSNEMSSLAEMFLLCWWVLFHWYLFTTNSPAAKFRQGSLEYSRQLQEHSPYQIVDRHFREKKIIFKLEIACKEIINICSWLFWRMNFSPPKIGLLNMRCFMVKVVCVCVFFLFLCASGINMWIIHCF